MRNVISVFMFTAVDATACASLPKTKAEKENKFPIPFETSRETDCDEVRVKSGKFTTTEDN